MADLRNSINTALPTIIPARPMSPARSAALLQAPRAFFEAALTQSPAPVQPAKASAVTAATEDAPTRLPRPGSLIDIKV